MDQQAWDRINTLENDIRKAHRNDVCLYPGCREKPIGSHLIAEQTLKMIAQEGHVLTWLPKTSYTFLKNVEAGKSLETWDEEPVRVGISARNKVTSPLFCMHHDQYIFEPLEKHVFSNTYKQVALLTYRTVCDMVLDLFAREKLLAMYKEDIKNVQKESTRSANFREAHLTLKAFYERIISASSEYEIDWVVFHVNMQPCLAATYCFIPLNGDDPAILIDSEAKRLVEDILTFSVLPQERESLCIISWLKGSQRAAQFLEQGRVQELSQNEREDFILSRAFESPTLYLSPRWWDSLNLEERTRYKTVRSEVQKGHAALE